VAPAAVAVVRQWRGPDRSTRSRRGSVPEPSGPNNVPSAATCRLLSTVSEETRTRS
jgi:hypothetical protein